MPAVSSRTGTSALVFVDGVAGGGNAVYAASSDGRGTEWTAPIRIDSDATSSPKYTQGDSVVVYDGHVYATWIDTRHGNQELYFNHSTDGGATWAGEVLLQKGYATGIGSVNAWAMSVGHDWSGGPNDVYLLIATTRPGTGEESLYFTASHDGGITFTAPLHLPAGFSAGLNDVGKFAIEVNRIGGRVVAIWQDNRASGGSNYDIYCQSTTTEGASWQPVDIQINSSAGNANGIISMSVSGIHVLVAWNDDRSGAAARELRTNWSRDGGASWEPADVQIGGYSPGVDDVSDVSCMLNNHLQAVAWIDDRSGTPEAYVSSLAPSSSAVWNEYPLSSGGANEIELIGHRNNLGVVWEDLAANTAIQSTFSRDGGKTWVSPQIQVSTTTGTASRPHIRYNKNYLNFLVTWVSDDLGTSNVYVGGYRPQTLNLAGTFQKLTPVTFDIEHFPVSQAGWWFGVLLSGGRGNYPMPYFADQNTGLLNDGYLAYSLANIPGALSGTVDATGSGSTATILIPSLIPDYTVLYFVAVSFDSHMGRQVPAPTDVESAVILP